MFTKNQPTKVLAWAALCMLFVWTSCSPQLEEVQESGKIPSGEANVPSAPFGSGGVMMQAFYWDVPAGGTWWNNLSSKVDDWSSAGITSMWVPPVSKAQNGPFSMGYDPFDYYDFGQYNQMGSTETRFGSKTELQSLISAAHSEGMEVYADIVINHNSGGASEANVFTGSNTWTDFQPASGKFDRTQYDFHPNDYHNNDFGAFGGFPDLCHHKTYVQDWLWNRSDAVAKYYKNVMGFDGWRFDYVKGFEPWIVKEWVNKAGGFAVGEYWDSNTSTLNWWANEANASVFDFALYYAMDRAFDGNNLNELNNAGFVRINPYRTVTFVANHDTDIIYNNKLLAYAFILSSEGYPCLFYRDYEEWLDKDKMNNLIWIHNNKAAGSTSQLHVDNDEYIMQRNGSPGLVTYLNISGSRKWRWVQTKYTNTLLHDYTGNSPDVWTDGNGWVEIQAPGNGYAIYSPN